MMIRVSQPHCLPRARTYDRGMRFFRRRPARSEKEAALAKALEATTRVRREQAAVERYRAGKQAAPADRMTTNQRIAGGS